MDATKHANDPWGPYANYDDIGRFQYGRMLWRDPAMRQRLLRHWRDVRHPYPERFAVRQPLIESILGSSETHCELDRRLRERGASLRSIAREIPPVFGSFF